MSTPAQRARQQKPFSVMVVEELPKMELEIACNPDNMPSLIIDADCQYYVLAGQLLSGPPGNRFRYIRAVPVQISHRIKT